MNEKQSYFQWLMTIIDIAGNTRTYSRLLDTLNHVTFIYSSQLDEDRVGDGKRLRQLYCMNKGIPYNDDTSTVSVLEMMIGIALRGEIHIMADNMIGDRTGIWFWTMINNLGLLPYSDNQYNSSEVNDIISRFLRREYKPNGEGGLFPCSDPSKDMREIDIWQQMCLWFSDILEKEGFFE